MDRNDCRLLPTCRVGVYERSPPRLFPSPPPSICAPPSATATFRPPYLAHFSTDSLHFFCVRFCLTISSILYVSRQVLAATSSSSPSPSAFAVRVPPDQHRTLPNCPQTSFIGRAIYIQLSSTRRRMVKSSYMTDSGGGRNLLEALRSYSVCMAALPLFASYFQSVQPL